MSIKNRIRLSNILMLLVPVVIAAVGTLFLWITPFGNRLYLLEQMYQDENGMWSAQSFIYTYQQELWENNWASSSQSQEQQGIRQSDTMYHLEKKLAKLGYHIMVKKAGNVIYSNMSQEDQKTAAAIAGGAVCSSKMFTASQGNTTVIKSTFLHEDTEFAIIAVNRGLEESSAVSYLRSYLIQNFLILLALLFVTIVLVNWLLSWWVSRSMLIPLKQLSQGTKRIRDGDLNTRLEYNRKDEFQSLFQDFEQMRERLKELTKQRMENEQRRREMINGVSHDLRTPLTSIGGYVDGLMDGIADTPEKRKRYISAIKIRTRDLERLVDSLSEYSRMDSGQIPYHMEYGSLKKFLIQYIETYGDEAKDNKVSVHLDCGGPDGFLYFDPERMKRVFDNLFINTIRYRTRQESQVQIRLKTSEDGKRIQVTYQDDGPGVPAESLERIFDTFYRTDEARSQAGRGSGIGLAVVREIVRGHNGTVWAQNHHGLAIIMEFPTGEETKEE